MRDTLQIIEESKSAQNFIKLHQLQLEVLLDIREFLQESAASRKEGLALMQASSAQMAEGIPKFFEVLEKASNCFSSANFLPYPVADEPPNADNTLTWFKGGNFTPPPSAVNPFGEKIKEGGE